MIRRSIEFIFFGNYFYALCAVSLSVEASLQQSIGLNSLVFYLLMSVATIVYYTYAYMGEISISAIFTQKKIHITHAKPNKPYNQRSDWYRRNEKILNITQVAFLIIGIALSLYLIVAQFHHIFSLSLSEWLILLSVPVVAGLYYGNSYFPVVKFNLRQSGWLKPFVIGFVWAGVVTLYPPMFHQWQHNLHYTFSWLTFWFFIKNGMYISVLAILFDIKDYTDDSNRQLKTYVVQVGLRKTIFMIVLPLTIIGVIAFSIFAYAAHFHPARYFFDLIPFVLLLLVAYSMHRRKPIMYYLIIIDGLMLVKGLCGIFATLLFK